MGPPPQIIHFNGVWHHYFHHPFWGGNPLFLGWHPYANSWDMIQLFQKEKITLTSSKWLGDGKELFDGQSGLTDLFGRGYTDGFKKETEEGFLKMGRFQWCSWIKEPVIQGSCLWKFVVSSILSDWVSVVGVFIWTENQINIDKAESSEECLEFVEFLRLSIHRWCFYSNSSRFFQKRSPLHATRRPLQVQGCIDDPKFHRHIFPNPQFWEFGNLGMHIKMVGLGI